MLREGGGGPLVITEITYKWTDVCELELHGVTSVLVNIGMKFSWYGLPVRLQHTNMLGCFR